jgi:integrase
LAVEHARRATGETTPDIGLRFDAAADAWLAVRVSRLRPNTRAIYGAHLAHLRERFGRQRLATITPTEVATMVAELDAGGVAGLTQRGRLTVLSGVFTFAGRHLGHAGVNPVSLLDRVERPSTDDETPRRVLGDDELARLLAAVAAPHRLLFELIAETGLRKSEAAGLAWGDADLDAMTLRVALQLDRHDRGRVALKTKRSARTIVITSDLARRLREHLMSNGRPGAHELMFRRPTGATYNGSSIDGALRTARRRAGLGAIVADGRVVARAPTPHDLRHTHASRLIAAGWDLVEVAARLGDSVETVLSEYAHEFDAVRRQDSQRDRLSVLYGSALEATERNAAQRELDVHDGEVAVLQARRDAAQ